MPRKDLYHDVVKTALEKDGCRIVKEDLPISSGGINFFVDIEAEAMYVAEREGEQIAVEVKTFQGQSLVQNMHEAFGKYILYRYAIVAERPELNLFLAIPLKAYNTFFQLDFIKNVITKDKVNLIVYDTENQIISKWLIH